MLQPEYTSQFKRDLKRVRKRGQDIEKLKIVMQLLIAEESLPASYRDHPLTSNWKGCRDLHIEPDWLLIYRINKSIVRFVRTGSHSDLFR